MHIVSKSVEPCIKRSVTSRLREEILPPLHSALMRLHPGVLLPVLEPPAQEGQGAVGVGPRGGHKNDQRAGAETG